jgi:hypothetical protein
MSVTDRYDINISGTGVVAADAITAYEDFVAAVRAVTPGYGVADWDDAHAYSLNDLIKPGNGHYYKATTAGTSGGARPTFPTNGGTVGDGVGALVWTDQGVAGTGPTGTLSHTSGTSETAEEVA